MPRDTPQRAEKLAADLRQVFGALTRRLRAETADSELSQSEHSVLKHLLDHGPATTADLARAEWVKPQSMGATLAGLGEGGFVARAADAEDGRRRTITVTEKGKRHIQAGRAARQSWLARALEDALTPDEQRAVQEAIALLARVIQS